MQSSLSRLIKVLSVLTFATGLVACTTSRKAPVNYQQLSTIISGLPGTQGKTEEDQTRIDRVIARGCSSGISTDKECNLHTKKSAERRKELKNVR